MLPTLIALFAVCALSAQNLQWEVAPLSQRAFLHDVGPTFSLSLDTGSSRQAGFSLRVDVVIGFHAKTYQFAGLWTLP